MKQCLPDCSEVRSFSVISSTKIFRFSFVKLVTCGDAFCESRSHGATAVRMTEMGVVTVYRLYSTCLPSD